MKKHLKLGDEKHRNLFNNTINALSYCEFIFDGQGNPCDLRFLDVNPAQEKLLGIPRDKIIGKTCIDLEILTSTQCIELVQEADEYIQFGKPYQTQYFCSHLKKWVEVKLFELYKDYFGLILVDITERKNAKEAQLKAYLELEKKVAERTSELQTKNSLLNTEIERVKLTEKILRESEEKYRTIFDSMDEAFCIYRTSQL
jgi:PAS domain S-box-containing protein